MLASSPAAGVQAGREASASASPTSFLSPGAVSAGRRHLVVRRPRNISDDSTRNGPSSACQIAASSTGVVRGGMHAVRSLVAALLGRPRGSPADRSGTPRTSAPTLRATAGSSRRISSTAAIGTSGISSLTGQSPEDLLVAASTVFWIPSARATVSVALRFM